MFLNATTETILDISEKPNNNNLKIHESFNKFIMQYCCCTRL